MSPGSRLRSPQLTSAPSQVQHRDLLPIYRGSWEARGGHLAVQKQNKKTHTNKQRQIGSRLRCVSLRRSSTRPSFERCGESEWLGGGGKRWREERRYVSSLHQTKNSPRGKIILLVAPKFKLFFYILQEVINRGLNVRARVFMPVAPLGSELHWAN